MTVQVTADDGDGGTAVDQFTLTVRAPAGTGAADAEVTSRPAEGDTYRRGETIAVELTFADAVTMDLTGGEPALEIDLGGTPRKAGYTGGAGTRRLTFAYRVQTGDRDRDGVRITAVRLNGAAIGSDAGAKSPEAAPQLPAQTDRGDHKVDGGLPAVSITALAAETAEGTSAVFELRRTGTAAPELRGAIVVRDSGVAAEDRPSLSRAFLFRAGEPVRRVTVSALDDGVVSSGRTLRAEVARSRDVYVVGDPAVATVTVTDVSQGRPAYGLPIIRGAARVGERLTAEPARLTFSSTDWFRTRAVTVSVAADAAGGRATLSHVPETFYARHPGGDVTLRIAAAAASGAAAREAAATVTGVAVAPATGEDARWRAGEQVVATVYFSAPVAVAAGGGTPTLDLTLDGESRTARYRGGTGTAALEFAHPVSEADAGAERARVVPGSLARNGATIRDAAGVDAKLAFELAPYVTAVAVAADPDGDGRWSAGEEITVWVAISADVTVDTGEGTPTLGLLVAARQRRAAYVDGSGTRTLRFSYAVPAAAAAVHAVLVEADSLTAGGGTIRAETGRDAELAHAGADRSGSPPDAEPDPEPVPGPEVAVALSVADARATEGVDATLDSW